MIYIGQSLTTIDYTGCILKWSPSIANDVDGYDVYMQEGEKGTPKKMNDSLIKNTEWVSPPLRADLVYYFYLTATDTSGNVSTKGNSYPFRLDPTITELNIIIIDRLRSVPLPLHSTHLEPVLTKDCFMRFQIGGTP